MEVQPQLFLLQKTLLHIESLGRQIYPELNLWVAAKPILEKWMRKRYSVKTMLKNISEHLPYVAENIVALPKLCRGMLEEQRKARGLKTWQEMDRKIHPRPSRLKYFLLGVGVTALLVLMM